MSGFCCGCSGWNSRIDLCSYICSWDDEIGSCTISLWCIVYIHISNAPSHGLLLFFFKSVLKSLDVLAAEQKINTKQKHPLCSPWIRPIMTLNEAPFLLCLVEGHLLHASVVNIHGIFPSFFQLKSHNPQAVLSALEPSGGTCATTCPSFMDVAFSPGETDGRWRMTPFHMVDGRNLASSRLSHYLQMFFTSQVVSRITSINTFWVISIRIIVFVIWIVSTFTSAEMCFLSHGCWDRLGILIATACDSVGMPWRMPKWWMLPLSKFQVVLLLVLAYACCLALG